jgi:hypothetical protein
MTDREKLIEMITTYMEFVRTATPKEMADHLLANGVVVREWIPVTERLPEEDGSYLCYSQYCGSGWCAVRSFAKDGRKKDEYDFQRRWKNVWYDYDSEYGYCVIDSITHWMPLPEPPKGE